MKSNIWVLLPFMASLWSNTQLVRAFVTAGSTLLRLNKFAKFALCKRTIHHPTLQNIGCATMSRRQKDGNNGVKGGSNRSRRRPDDGPDRPGQHRCNISAGTKVEVVQKHHQRSGELTSGIVGRLLTSAPFHPRGIKVMLHGGVVGRVQNLVPPETAATATPGEPGPVGMSNTGIFGHNARQSPPAFSSGEAAAVDTSGGPYKG
ncbi:unnamed protein product, partial [Discosporangium mesarthrocarpum]